MSETITVCTFQPKVVYDEIKKNGVFRMSRDNFIKYAQIEKSYIHHHKLEKYDRLMKKSKLNFKPNTMPIWAWYKETDGVLVSPTLYSRALDRNKEENLKYKGQHIEFVGLFLKVKKEEIYLTNFLYWDFFLFNNRDDTDIENYDNWTDEHKKGYQEQVDEEELYFSMLDDIEGNVKVQGILTEIREDMIVEVLRESK